MTVKLSEYRPQTLPEIIGLGRKIFEVQRLSLLALLCRSVREKENGFYNISTRYEYERFRHPDMNETQFEMALKKRGSDYAMIR
jgi:hypothetical protein